MYHEINLQQASPIDDVQSLDWTLEVRRDPSPNKWFWAMQFTVAVPDGKYPYPFTGGYVGLQSIGATLNQRVALFSMWSTVGCSAGDAKYGRSLAQPFSGEGEGHQCMISFPWQVGTRHALHLEYEVATNMWKATAGGVLIGRIQPQADWNKSLRPHLTAFMEHFGPPDANSPLGLPVAYWDNIKATRAGKPVRMASHSFHTENNAHAEDGLGIYYGSK